MNKIKNEQGTLRKLERRVPYFIEYIDKPCLIQ